MKMAEIQQFHVFFDTPKTVAICFILLHSDSWNDARVTLAPAALLMYHTL